MSSYKLHYFNARGRAEVSRLIFVVAGEKFEDARIEMNDWPNHKASMPLGQLPVLEYNGKKIPQSISIARFLAKQFGLAGKDNLEQAQVDSVVDTIGDCVTKYVVARFEKDPEKKEAALKVFFSEELSKHLKNLETLANHYSNGGPYFVGNQLTLADLFFYDIGENFLQENANSLNEFPWLQKNRQQVASNPRIAEYVKNRAPTPF